MSVRRYASTGIQMRGKRSLVASLPQLGLGLTTPPKATEAPKGAFLTVKPVAVSPDQVHPDSSNATLLQQPFPSEATIRLPSPSRYVRGDFT